MGGERERERENGAFKIAESQALSLDKINQNILGVETENLDLCNILKGFWWNSHVMDLLFLIWFID